MKRTAIQTHPLPARHKVHWFYQLIGLFGAPTAWAGQMCLSAIVSSYACYPLFSPLDKPLSSWFHPLLSAISIASFITGFISAYIAWSSWKKSRKEAEGGVHHVVETGAGRTRFLALLGLWVSIFFMITIALTATALLLVKPC